MLQHQRGQQWLSLTMALLLAVTPTTFTWAESAPAPQDDTDRMIEKAIKRYNMFETTDVLITIWKLDASSKDTKYLEKLEAQVKTRQLPKAFYHGDKFVYFEGYERPMKVVDASTMQLSYAGRPFTVIPNEIEKTMTAINQVVSHDTKKFSLLDLFLPQAHASFGDYILPLAMGGAAGGLTGGGMLGGIACAGSSALAFSMGKDKGIETAAKRRRYRNRAPASFYPPAYSIYPAAAPAAGMTPYPTQYGAAGR